REDELFYVLEGEFDLYVGREVFKVHTGECVFLPRFKPHTFVIRSAQLRVLILFAPGGLEEAFRGMSVPAKNLEPPTEAPIGSAGALGETVQQFSDGAARFLGPEEVADQMPLYLESLLQHLGKSRNHN